MFNQCPRCAYKETTGVKTCILCNKTKGLISFGASAIRGKASCYCLNCEYALAVKGSYLKGWLEENGFPENWKPS